MNTVDRAKLVKNAGRDLQGAGLCLRVAASSSLLGAAQAGAGLT